MFNKIFKRKKVGIKYKKPNPNSKLYKKPYPVFAKPDYALEALDEAKKKGAFTLKKKKKSKK